VLLDSTEAIKSAVEVCNGIAFVSRWAISKELELGTLKVVEVKGVRATRHFSSHNAHRTGTARSGGRTSDICSCSWAFSFQ
jgi:DNA-binding transcriptional LysR family regulator